MVKGRPNTLEDFWRHVRFSDPCWLWTGAPGSEGYGVFAYEGVQHSAHRFMLEVFVLDLPPGALPREFDACHRCDVRPCVKPSHLFLGTRLDNMRDAAEKGRMASGERHPAKRPEVREKMALARIGRTLTEVHRRRIGLAQKGRAQPRELVERRRQSRLSYERTKRERIANESGQIIEL
jgi:hypothetical protein